MRTNTLSALGRMSYATHLALYPVIGGSVYFVLSSYLSSSAEKAKIAEREAMPALQKVDPDNFNPFSAIPFHNNPELRYRYANIRMFGYLDKTTHMNLRDYPYKSYHNSFDHDNQYTHLYNWVSMVPSHEAKREASRQVQTA